MKQRGGKIFAEEGKENYYYIDDARADTWRAKINSSKLKSIFENIGLTDKDPSHRTAADQDLVIAYQDELFYLALQIAADILKIDMSDKQKIIQAAEANNSQTATVMEYILDVGKLVLSIETIPSTTENITKMQRLTKDNITRLFVFPARLRNMFIESLVNVFKVLDTFKDIISQNKSTDTINILGDFFDANVRSNMTLQTSLIYHRDGFYLGQPTNASPVGPQESSFFRLFVGELQTLMIMSELPAVKDLTGERIINKEKNKIMNNVPLWEKITALVYVYYEKKQLDDLKEKVKALPVTEENNRHIRYFVMHLCHKLETDTPETA